MQDDLTPDVITLGETMLRFTPSGYERFEQSGAVEIHVGGSESNTAVGLARLGHRCSWISRLTSNPIGHLIANSIASHGVDVSNVVWTDRDRVGTFYMERGAGPRSSTLFYDRANSAMSHMNPADLPGDLFHDIDADRQKNRFFHTTGITIGISKSAAETALHAAKLAKVNGWQVSFDFNYRARLWSLEEATAGCQAMMELADLIILPLRDAQSAYSYSSKLSVQQTCMELHERWPRATIALTLGADGACAVTHTGEAFEQPAVATEQIERLGGGDAFSAGFLSGLLQGGSVDLALRWGTAAAAIKYTIPGDLPIFDRELVAEFADGERPKKPSINR